MKTLLKIGAAFAVVAALGVWFLASNIDGFVKQLIEEVGTETLATEVSLGSVSISLGSESRAVLSDLTIANPPGYTQPYAFELGTVGASIDAASLPNEVVVIPRVLIENARLTFEQDGGGSNLQTLLDNMDSESSDPAADASADEADDVLIAIGELTLTDVSVTAISDQLDEPVEFVLPSIVVRNIGTSEQGVTHDEAAELIVEPVIDAALAQAKQQVKAIVEARVRAELDKKKGEATENLKKSLRDKLRL